MKEKLMKCLTGWNNGQNQKLMIQIRVRED